MYSLLLWEVFLSILPMWKSEKVLEFHCQQPSTSALPDVMFTLTAAATLFVNWFPANFLFFLLVNLKLLLSLPPFLIFNDRSSGENVDIYIYIYDIAIKIAVCLNIA